MEVTWTVNDGYAGGSRPQTIDVPDEELNDCATVEDKKKLIEQYVQDDFDCSIDWEITDYGIYGE